GGGPAEHPFEDPQREAPLVLARDPGAAKAHVVLLGVFLQEAHTGGEVRPRREATQAARRRIGAHAVARRARGPASTARAISTRAWCSIEPAAAITMLAGR